MSAGEPITDLAEAVAVYGAFPMPVPVGPEPLSPEREAEIREWVEAMGRKKDIRYYGSWQQHGELLGEIDRLRAQVAGLNESLSAAAVRMRADAARIAELEALTPARVQTCRVCGAGYTYGEPCSSCEFRKRMAAELQARGLDGEHYPLVHHSYRVGHDLPETGGPQ